MMQKAASAHRNKPREVQAPGFTPSAKKQTAAAPTSTTRNQVNMVTSRTQGMERAVSYEDDEFIERFTEWTEYARKRHEDDVLTAAEQSLADVSSSECPPPLTWHPFYRGKTYLLDWLNGVGELAHAEWTIRLPKPRRSFMVSPDDLGPTAERSFDVITMTKQRAWGPAPWTGEPYHYEWCVGTDDLGRRIAGESKIVYEEGVRRWQALGLYP